jgi:D-alanyl-D-alanine carboxypeptidase
VTVVANKRRPLNPVSYEPADLVQTSVISNPNGRLLRAEVAAQVDRMATDASAAGIFLTVLSGYRSYATQEQTYNNFVARDGEERANQYSAKPGHSEHQTGLAVDFDDGQGRALYNCFADTAAGQWLAANAWQYGFILRYKLGSELITGYEFEPWHYRYVGIEVSTAMHNTGVSTLEEFFGLEPAPTY